ncbi:hypothetical protein GLAREA_10991 [Glarea lozoyensis ATCC 20868]|uniref:C2H2-type domain-containing protein n=1 Tax=Glarea lozoyensis (strain ATCC 20868 / MF5171) TaxID=1116229 RepID=S3DA36_GLAL2|nr:uncharacterized protein GLAREA_10991 [Glarea lozoyensis ATCC 20868]EPE35292.1 hypothetical protein GLAREA_10991 [Glarea lozoyensis ATCC 20868]
MAPSIPSSPRSTQPLSPRKQVTIASGTTTILHSPVATSTGPRKSALKKRPAEDDLQETPEPKKTFFGFNIPYLSDIFSPSAARERERAEEEEALLKEVSPKPKPPIISISPREHARMIADAVDATFAARNANQADRALNDRSRKLKWRPEITADDEEYINQEHFFTKLLSSKPMSVPSILEAHFEEAQILRIKPSLKNPSIIKVQEHDAKEYYKLLSKGGPFYGRGDNLTTKLTMLKFGFPVAPMTHTNLHNAGRDVLADDPEDEEIPGPKYQRIEHSEKPLEFLDSYSQRSFGFPMLRESEKEYQSYVGEEEEELNPKSGIQSLKEKKRRPSQVSPRNHKNPPPIYPDSKSPALGLRGGGGAGSTENLKPNYLYSYNRGRIQYEPTASDSEQTFLECAGTLLHFDPESGGWAFNVDQYKDRVSGENTTTKIFHDTREITKATFSEVFKSFIKNKINSRQRDWPLVVRPVDVERLEGFELPTEDYIPPKILSPRRSRSSSRKHSASKASPKKKVTIAPVVEVQNIEGVTDVSSSAQVLQTSVGLQNQAEGPRLNKERILKPRSAPVQIQRFDPWMAEERRLDRLQRESWLHDHSAIEPGQKPEPPLFGTPKDLLIGQTDALPRIYSHRLTPTDFNQVVEENQTARYKLLERIDACPLCPATFELDSAEERTNHFKLHADQIASAGKCPICESEQWMMMDMDQRRDHLAYHQKASPKEASFDKLDCPVCNKKLSKIGDTEDILFHMAEHTPGVLKYCDRCGLNIKACSQIELLNHKKICIDGPERLSDDDQLYFCDVCGRNRTHETEEQLVSHRKFCFLDKGVYCFKCGLDMTKISKENQQRHELRCHHPRGYRKKWCQKCGSDMSKMNDTDKKHHQQSCYAREPEPVSADSRKKEIQLLIQKQADLNAQNRAIESEIRSNLTALSTPGAGAARWAHDTGPCPVDGCQTSLSNYSPSQIIKHMKTHTDALHCPIIHQDGDVMCVHTAETGLPVSLNPQSQSVFDTLREKYAGFRERTTRATERLNAVSTVPRAHTTSPRKETRNSATSPRKEPQKVTFSSPIKKVHKPAVSPKKGQPSPRKSVPEETASSKKPFSRKRKLSTFQDESEFESESSFSSGDEEDEDMPPGASESDRHKSTKGRRGAKNADGSYRYEHLPDIPIPEEEVVPDSLNSPEKVEALQQSTKKRGTKNADGSYRYQHLPDIPIPEEEVVPDSLTSPEKLQPLTHKPVPVTPGKKRGKSVPPATKSPVKPKSPVKIKSAKGKNIAEEKEMMKAEKTETKRVTRNTRSSATPVPMESLVEPKKKVATPKKGRVKGKLKGKDKPRIEAAQKSWSRMV